MSANLGQLQPPETAAQFEALCRDVVAAVFADPGAQAYGRSGQKQAVFEVEVWFWERIRREIGSTPRLQNLILHKYYRGLLDALQTRSARAGTGRRRSNRPARTVVAGDGSLAVGGDVHGNILLGPLPS